MERAMTGQVEADDFDVAKAIFDKLKDIPAERKKRILGWVAESLGVVLAPAPSAPAPYIPPAAPGFPPPAPAPAGGSDIKSFVAAKAPKSDMQFAATVAYYYRFEAPPASRKNAITGDDLQEAARLAGRTRLAKPRNTLNNAKTAGYLDSAAVGEFAINSVGENLVAMTLPGTSAPVGNGRSRKPAKKKTRR
jgi:hypothetical protein